MDFRETGGYQKKKEKKKKEKAADFWQQVPFETWPTLLRPGCSESHEQGSRDWSCLGA